MMTIDEAVVVLRTAGFRPTALHHSVVTAERGVAGHPLWSRVCVVSGFENDWKATLVVRRPGAVNLFEYEVQELFERSCIASAEHLELWLGGVVSHPVDDTEIRALLERSAA